MFELRYQFFIESSRFLPNLPENHPCRRLHGHSFKIVTVLRGELDPQLGWVYDFHEIEKHVRPLLSQLDHRVLNEISGLENPTSENLAKYLFDQIRAKIPLLVQIHVQETRDSECRYPVLPNHGMI